MSVLQKRKTIEAMLINRAKKQPGASVEQTSLSRKELKEIGASERHGKLWYTVHWVSDGVQVSSIFELLPRVGK